MQVTVQEILTTLTPEGPSGEPAFVRESRDLLTEIGEAPSPTESVEDGAGQVRLVQRDLGSSVERDFSDLDSSHGPPGPSATALSCVRLQALLGGLGRHHLHHRGALPDSAMATGLFKEILIQMDPLGTRPETGEEP